MIGSLGNIRSSIARQAICIANLPGGGSHQLAVYLPRNRFHASRHRVRHLIGIMGLQAICKGPPVDRQHMLACVRAGKKHPLHLIYPYLLNKLPITRSYHVWCSGITYIPVRRGFCIWSQSWIGQPARFWHGDCRTRWTPASASRL